MTATATTHAIFKWVLQQVHFQTGFTCNLLELYCLAASALYKAGIDAVEQLFGKLATCRVCIAFGNYHKHGNELD